MEHANIKVVFDVNIKIKETIEKQIGRGPAPLSNMRGLFVALLEQLTIPMRDHARLILDVPDEIDQE